MLYPCEKIVVETDPFPFTTLATCTVAQYVYDGNVSVNVVVAALALDATVHALHPVGSD